MDTKIKINLGAIMKEHEKDLETTTPVNGDNNKNINISSDISSKIGNDDKKKIGIKQVLKDDDILIEEVFIEKDEKKTDKTGKEKNIANELIEKAEKEEIRKNLTEKKEIDEKKEETVDNNNNKEEAEQDDVLPGKKVFISLNNIQKNNISDEKKIQDEEEEKKKKEALEKEEKEKSDIEKIASKSGNELFSNYEAAFAKKKDSILEKIQKLKNLPKTRPLFISSLIMITVIGVGGLFYIDPENHSIDSYKTSIINAIDKNNLLYEKGVINDNIQPPPLIYEKEKIQLGGLNFEVEINIVNDKKVFKFNGKTYNSDAELKEIIQIEVDKIKRDKLIEELKKISNNN